jgi:A/G-specific adenine glycosylase
MSKKILPSIAEILENWYAENKRDLPWRMSSVPYHIWISEVILQQTRVNQGLAYYNKFIEHYPEIKDLANAETDEILKLWQGLGYYTRARNMHATARIIMNDFAGVFPESYEELIKLKGIGEYTAAAIASIAFNKPVAVVDGNVQRVIARLFDVNIPFGSSQGRAIFNHHANELLNTHKPAIHNQAMMEFGATVCLPMNPKCFACLLADHCKAFIRGTVTNRPVKKQKIMIRTRFFNYFFIRNNGTTFISKRLNKDIWNSLYEFPLIETSSAISFQEIILMKEAYFISDKIPLITQPPKIYKHKLTHQQLICSFYSIESDGVMPGNFQQVPLAELHKYAVPVIIYRYLKDLETDGLL